MKNKYYTSRDPIKNYFPLPNEVFNLGLFRLGTKQTDLHIGELFVCFYSMDTNAL